MRSRAVGRMGILDDGGSANHNLPLELYWRGRAYNRGIINPQTELYTFLLRSLISLSIKMCTRVSLSKVSSKFLKIS